jgi:hypothetical protein
MVSTNRDETTWLASRFSLLSCNCADRSRFNKALSLSELDCFCALGNDTLRQSLNVFYDSKHNILFKITVNVFIADISLFLETKCAFVVQNQFQFSRFRSS